MRRIASPVSLKELLTYMNLYSDTADEDKVPSSVLFQVRRSSHTNQARPTQAHTVPAQDPHSPYP